MVGVDETNHSNSLYTIGYILPDLTKVQTIICTEIVLLVAQFEDRSKFIDEVCLKDVMKRGKNITTFDLLMNEFESKINVVVAEPAPRGKLCQVVYRQVVHEAANITLPRKH